MKLQVETLGEQVENREQQIQQLSQVQTGVEREEHKVVEAETQLQALKAENKQLRVSRERKEHKVVEAETQLHALKVENKQLRVGREGGTQSCRGRDTAPCSKGGE